MGLSPLPAATPSPASLTLPPPSCSPGSTRSRPAPGFAVGFDEPAGLTCSVQRSGAGAVAELCGSGTDARFEMPRRRVPQAGEGTWGCRSPAVSREDAVRASGPGAGLRWGGSVAMPGGDQAACTVKG